MINSNVCTPECKLQCIYFPSDRTTELLWYIAINRIINYIKYWIKSQNNAFYLTPSGFGALLLYLQSFQYTVVIIIYKTFCKWFQLQMNLGCNCVHKVKEMQFIKCKLYFILLIRMFSALRSTLLQPWSDRRPQSQSCFMNAEFSRHSEDMRGIFVALSGKGRIQGTLCFSTTHKSIDCASELWQLHFNM